MSPKKTSYNSNLNSMSNRQSYGYQTRRHIQRYNTIAKKSFHLLPPFYCTFVCVCVCVCVKAVRKLNSLDIIYGGKQVFYAKKLTNNAHSLWQLSPPKSQSRCPHHGLGISFIISLNASVVFLRTDRITSSMHYAICFITIFLAPTDTRRMIGVLYSIYTRIFFLFWNCWAWDCLIVLISEKRCTHQ